MKLVIPTGLKAVDEMIGGLPMRLPVNLFGPPMCGKSIFWVQFAYQWLSKIEGNALFVDTEGGLTNILETWGPIFNQRFKTKTEFKELEPETAIPSTKVNTIYLLDVRQIGKILHMHGFDVKLDISTPEKEETQAKITVNLRGFCDNWISKMVKEARIKFLCYDSITNPLTTVFVGGRINFPSRADATNLWLNALQQVADEYDILIGSTSHRSVDPTNPFDQIGGKTGGETIDYNFKLSLYMQPSLSQQKHLKNRKKIWVERYFNLPQWDRYGIVELTDVGFVDIAGKEPGGE